MNTRVVSYSLVSMPVRRLNDEVFRKICGKNTAPTFANTSNEDDLNAAIVVVFDLRTLVFISTEC